MRLRLLPALAFGLLATAPFVPAGAQRLTGVTLLPGATSPAAGVLIVARDSTGAEVARTVSAENGTFSVYVDSTRTLTYTAMRTGFGPTDMGSRRLRDNQFDSVRVTLGAEAVAWPKSAPRGATTCSGGRPEGRAAVELLLEEARKVMAIAQFRLGSSESDMRFTTFQHRTAKNGEDTLYTMMRRGSGTPPAIFEDTPTEELERRGFFGTIAGERTFATPGFETLPSEWFLGTHCFTLGRVTPEEYVLRFEPTRERRGLVDVEGEYHFDRAMGGLRLVTFRYVNLPTEERKSAAGGALEFAKTGNGSWLARHWHQRFPLLGYTTASGATTFVQSEMTLVDITGHRVIGGRVNAVLARNRPAYQHDPHSPPVLRTPFGQACPERVVTAATTAARGKLVAEDSLGVDRVAVRATWKVLAVVDRTQMTEREHVRETLSGPEGEWTLCDLPIGRDIELRWSVRGKETKRQLKYTEPNRIELIP